MRGTSVLRPIFSFPHQRCHQQSSIETCFPAHTKGCISLAVRYVAQEWAAPIVALAVVSGIVLAVVCVVFAPTE
jgi:hypothetical protein